MYACTEAEKGITPRDVIRGVNSHNCNQVGIHWLRISFNQKDLQEIKSWIDRFYGESDSDGYGLWSYDSRYIWPSGASMNYDSDVERSQRVHRGRFTFECPGKACDELTAPDLLLMIQGFEHFQGLCTRIDIFFDDYRRIVEPYDLHELIERYDYTGFRKAGYRPAWDCGRRCYDEAWFGRRGQNGSGKYLRCYDKKLESDGEKDCVRWEIEFSQKKSQKVFIALSGCEGDIVVFATICGALIGGCISFVHRNGDRNINRLDVYDFWQLITESLGKLTIRIEKIQNTLTGVIEWTERQVAPSLACVRKTFVSDQKFIAWVIDMLDDGASRMNAHQRQLVSRFEGSMNYDPKINEDQQLSEYVRLTCKLR